MKLLRDFCCETCGTVQERFIDGETLAVNCACGAIANRIIGMPRVALDGTDPSFPGAYDKWRREQALLRTFKKRPDMLEKAELTKKDLKFIESLKLEEKSEQ